MFQCIWMIRIHGHKQTENGHINGINSLLHRIILKHTPLSRRTALRSYCNIYSISNQRVMSEKFKLKNIDSTIKTICDIAHPMRDPRCTALSVRFHKKKQNPKNSTDLNGYFWFFNSDLYRVQKQFIEHNLLLSAKLNENFTWKMESIYCIACCGLIDESFWQYIYN